MTAGFCWSRSFLERGCKEPAAKHLQLALGALHRDALEQQEKRLKCGGRKKEHFTCTSHRLHKASQVCIYR